MRNQVPYESKKIAPDIHIDTGFPNAGRVRSAAAGVTDSEPCVGIPRKDAYLPGSRVSDLWFP